MCNAGIHSYTWYLVLFDLPLQVLVFISNSMNIASIWFMRRTTDRCSRFAQVYAAIKWCKHSNVYVRFLSLCSNYNNSRRLRSLSKVSSVSKQYQQFFSIWVKEIRCVLSLSIIFESFTKSTDAIGFDKHITCHGNITYDYIEYRSKAPNSLIWLAFFDDFVVQLPKISRRKIAVTVIWAKITELIIKTMATEWSSIIIIIRMKSMKNIICFEY